MSSKGLENLIRPVTLITSGVECSERKLTFIAAMRSPGGRAIKIAMQKIFGARELEPEDIIICWYDVLRDCGDKSHYLCLENTYILGVLYRKGESDLDQVSHFFVRKFDKYWGPLDSWITDITFPIGTSSYSVLAVFPNDFEMSTQGLSDPHNHAVTQMSQKHLEELGVSLNDIVTYITYAGLNQG